MPLIITPSAVTDAFSTTTVGNSIDCAKNTLQERFATAGSTNLLIKWVEAVQQTILHRRRWDWMLSAPKRFVTEVGQTDYWIGATSGVGLGQVDTGLNLSD